MTICSRHHFSLFLITVGTVSYASLPFFAPGLYFIIKCYRCNNSWTKAKYVIKFAIAKCQINFIIMCTLNDTCCCCTLLWTNCIEQINILHTLELNVTLHIWTIDLIVNVIFLHLLSLCFSSVDNSIINLTITSYHITT